MMLKKREQQIFISSAPDILENKTLAHNHFSLNFKKATAFQQSILLRFIFLTLAKCNFKKSLG
jgi:hypothetical protein